MNKLFLIGNITKEPELAETASGVKVCNFSLAVNRKYKGGDGERKTDYFECVAWRGLAETVVKYVHKGDKIHVEGSMEQENFEDSKGVKRTSYKVVVSDIEFLTLKGADSDKEGSKLQAFDDDGDTPF